eukprot:3362585-Amphidinium_carterae.1
MVIHRRWWVDKKRPILAYLTVFVTKGVQPPGSTVLLDDCFARVAMLSCRLMGIHCSTWVCSFVFNNFWMLLYLTSPGAV